MITLAKHYSNRSAHAPVAKLLLTCLLLPCIFGLGCAATPERVSAKGSGAVLHTVCFTFTTDTTEHDIDALADFYRTRVPGVPGIVSVFVGRQAMTGERAVVDREWGLLTSTLFESLEAEGVWQTHPIHDELKSRFASKLASVRVFDAIE